MQKKVFVFSIRYGGKNNLTAQCTRNFSTVSPLKILNQIQNFLLQKYTKIHLQQCRILKIFRRSTPDPRLKRMKEPPGRKGEGRKGVGELPVGCGGRRGIIGKERGPHFRGRDGAPGRGMEEEAGREGERYKKNKPDPTLGGAPRPVVCPDRREPSLRHCIKL
jgi:hypothetical protein